MADTMVTAPSTGTVKNIGKRKHPDLDEKLPIWNFLMASYRGGMGMQGRSGMSAKNSNGMKLNGYYAGLFQWRKENSDDYNNRVALTPYRPLARRIVSAFVNYVTKSDPERKGADALKDILSDADRNGNPLTEFTRIVLSRLKVMGQYNVLVDMPKAKRKVKSQADAIAQKLRPYCVPVNPQNVIDWNLTSTGAYEWAIIESTRIDNSIDQDNAVVIKTRTYWDGTRWERWVEDKQKQDWVFEFGDNHTVGYCPLLRFTAEDLDEMPDTPESWFYDLADLNRAIYNLDSIDLTNFHTQCFGQLVLPRHIGDSDQAKTASASEGWTESENEKGISRYIQPSGIEHENVLKAVADYKKSMFEVAGLYQAKESRDAQSAEAKSWDHEEMNQFLASFAKTANQIETKILQTAAAWQGTKNAAIEIVYPEEYKVVDLEKLIAAILDIKTLGYSSETLRKEAIKRAAREVLGDSLTPEVMKKIETEIDASVEEPDPLRDFDMNRQEQFTV